MENNIALRIFSFAVLLMGAVFMIFGVVSQYRQFQVQTWAETKGNITHSDFVDDSEGGRLTIEYEYSVAGMRFQSTQLAPAFMLYNAREMANKYPVGAAVTVYYNPDNPEEAVLERQSAVTWVPIFVGALCLVIAAILFFVVQ
ncbi:MAG: hypothetical protein CMR00_11450 [[Chlorobium] sp. 445]|nr:MAG: hypothetical protein CMR00_11450 [[Chlorobium] sp. 445]